MENFDSFAVGSTSGTGMIVNFEIEVEVVANPTANVSDRWPRSAKRTQPYFDAKINHNRHHQPVAGLMAS